MATTPGQFPRCLLYTSPILVILLTLLRVTQYFIGFIDFLKLVLRTWVISCLLYTSVPEASADSVVAVRDSLMVTERIGIRPTVAKDSPEVMPVVCPISSKIGRAHV